VILLQGRDAGVYRLEPVKWQLDPLSMTDFVIPRFKRFGLVNIDKPFPPEILEILYPDRHFAR
jgi:hypothetical protein